MSTGQAARELGLSANWTRELIARGDLQAIPTPVGKLVSRESLAKLKREREAAVRS